MKGYGWRSLCLWLFSGYNRRQEQVPYQWLECSEQPSKGSVLLSSAECKQSPFSHNARTYHKGSEYETTRGKYIFLLCFFIGVVLHLPHHRLFVCHLNFWFSFVVLQMVVQLHNFIHVFPVDICWIFSLCTDVTFCISTDLYMQTYFFSLYIRIPLIWHSSGQTGAGLSNVLDYQTVPILT